MAEEAQGRSLALKTRHPQRAVFLGGELDKQTSPQLGAAEIRRPLLVQHITHDKGQGEKKYAHDDFTSLLKMLMPAKHHFRIL